MRCCESHFNVQRAKGGERTSHMPYIETYQTREYNFILDPGCLFLWIRNFHQQFSFIMKALESAEPSIKISVIIPLWLTEPESIGFVQEQIYRITKLIQQDFPAEINLDVPIHGDKLKSVLGTEGFSKSRQLLALSEFMKADGIITAAEDLLKCRYDVHQSHRIRILPFEEFHDILEIIAHGHFIFLSTSSTLIKATFSVFYIMTHYKAKLLFRFYNSIMPTITDENLRENLRSALLNRYSYILYARDMVLFNYIQKDYCARRSIQSGHGLHLGYHLTIFYLLLWGMLDHLSVITKYHLNLPVEEFKVGIRSKEFKKQLSKVKANLVNYINSPNISKWIAIMADMRHQAAHKLIALPSEMVEHTDESKMGDEEVWDILKKEDLSLNVFDDESLNAVKSLMISNWRIDKMQTVASDMTFINKGKDSYFRNFVVSIDYDLERLNAMIDAFLFSLFN